MLVKTQTDDGHFVGMSNINIWALGITDHFIMLFSFYNTFLEVTLVENVYYVFLSDWFLVAACSRVIVEWIISYFTCTIRNCLKGQAPLLSVFSLRRIFEKRYAEICVYDPGKSKHVEELSLFFFHCWDSIRVCLNTLLARQMYFHDRCRPTNHLLIYHICTTSFTCSLYGDLKKSVLMLLTDVISTMLGRK